MSFQETSVHQRLRTPAILRAGPLCAVSECCICNGGQWMIAKSQFTNFMSFGKDKK